MSYHASPFIGKISHWNHCLAACPSKPGLQSRLRNLVFQIKQWIVRLNLRSKSNVLHRIQTSETREFNVLDQMTVLILERSLSFMERTKQRLLHQLDHTFWTLRGFVGADDFYRKLALYSSSLRRKLARNEPPLEKGKCRVRWHCVSAS